MASSRGSARDSGPVCRARARGAARPQRPRRGCGIRGGVRAGAQHPRSTTPTPRSSRPGASGRSPAPGRSRRPRTDAVRANASVPAGPGLRVVATPNPDQTLSITETATFSTLRTFVVLQQPFLDKRGKGFATGLHPVVRAIEVYADGVLRQDRARPARVADHPVPPRGAQRPAEVRAERCLVARARAAPTAPMATIEPLLGNEHQDELPVSYSVGGTTAASIICPDLDFWQQACGPSAVGPSLLPSAQAASSSRSPLRPSRRRSRALPAPASTGDPSAPAATASPSSSSGTSPSSPAGATTGIPQDSPQTSVPPTDTGTEVAELHLDGRHAAA